MNLRRLKYFVKIVDVGSLTQAADILHIAQPALSPEEGGEQPLRKKNFAKRKERKAAQLAARQERHGKHNRSGRGGRGKGRRRGRFGR